MVVRSTIGSVFKKTLSLPILENLKPGKYEIKYYVLMVCLGMNVELCYEAGDSISIIIEYSDKEIIENYSYDNIGNDEKWKEKKINILLDTVSDIKISVIFERINNQNIRHNFGFDDIQINKINGDIGKYNY